MEDIHQGVFTRIDEIIGCSTLDKVFWLPRRRSRGRVGNLFTAQRARFSMETGLITFLFVLLLLDGLRIPSFSEDEDKKSGAMLKTESCVLSFRESLY